MLRSPFVSGNDDPLLASQKAVDKPDCPLMPDKSRCESAPAGVVVMRVGVRDSLVRWVDEKPWRFKLILLLHTAVVGVILLMFGTRF